MYKEFLNDLKTLKDFGFATNLTGQQQQQLIKKLQPEQHQALVKIYKKWLKKDLVISCKNCIFDCFMEIAMLEKNKDFFVRLETALFELKKGSHLFISDNTFPQLFGNGDYSCMSNTLTDELAIFHLAVTPSKISMFCKYPPNWMDLAQAKRDELNEKFNGVKK